MAEAPAINVTELIEQRPVGRPQLWILALCAFVALLDGLDLQSIGLAAPAMIDMLHVAPQAFAWVFSAALAGLTMGSFTLGPVADRVGRKRVLVAATACFGVFTFCTALSSSFNELLVFRFLAGFGLGGAMPSFISLASEYMPTRLRATVVSLLWAGFPLGGVVGGLLASWIIPAFGWQSVFYIGGVLPIVVALLLVVALPESLGYLINSGASSTRVADALRRVFPGIAAPATARYVLSEQGGQDGRFSQLFAGGRGVDTALLWVSFFFAFMILVVNSSWSPTLLRIAGIPVPSSAVALAIFNFGSVIGSGAAGWLLTRFGAAAILPASFVLSALSYGLVGASAPSVAEVMLFQGLFGLVIGCASSGVIALAAVSYPTAIRSTGVGWAMALGRFGSFVGPLMVGKLLELHWPVADIFAGIGGSILIGGVASLVLGLRRGAPATVFAPALVHQVPRDGSGGRI